MKKKKITNYDFMKGANSVHRTETKICAQIVERTDKSGNPTAVRNTYYDRTPARDAA